jgi:hypothetical protein
VHAPRSEALPEHLPRYEVEARVPEQAKHCPEHGERMLIGYDRVEKLEFERPKLRVRVTKYPKYACRSHAECGIVSPERPAGMVEGDRFDTSVAAEIITPSTASFFRCSASRTCRGQRLDPDRSTLQNLRPHRHRFLRPLAGTSAGGARRRGPGHRRDGVTLLVPPTIPVSDPDDPKSGGVRGVSEGGAAVAEAWEHGCGPFGA